MFLDKVTIWCKAGNGGDGSVSFFRDKNNPNGGPDGGDGGRGGDIIFVANPSLTNLTDFRYTKHFRAENGANGGKRFSTGKSGKDLIIQVPQGTVIRNAENNKILCDLYDKGESVTLLRGGKGGVGNTKYATPTRQAPRFSEMGVKTKEYQLLLELKTIADVGLVGFPNVGKSSLLASVSNARPKIANYHFTTLAPNIGVVKAYGSSFVMADIPGLIEGASEGEGLGLDFLRHIERTRLLVHVVDIAGSEGRDPYQDYELIRKELGAFNEKLHKKQEIIIANKMDLPNAKDELEKFKKKIGDIEIFLVSAATNTGLNVVVDRLADLVDQVPNSPLYDDSQIESHVLYKFKKEEPFTITRDDDGTWVVSGHEVERLFKMTKFSSDEAAYKFAKKLRRMGIDQKLEELGIEEGDQVRILDFYFDYRK